MADDASIELEPSTASEEVAHLDLSKYKSAELVEIWPEPKLLSDLQTSIGTEFPASSMASSFSTRTTPFSSSRDVRSQVEIEVLNWNVQPSLLQSPLLPWNWS